MNTPSIVKLTSILDSETSTENKEIGRWVPARPLGWQGFFLMKRIKAAWKVFIGELDALDWRK